MPRISLRDQCIKALAGVTGPTDWPNTGGVALGLEAMLRTATRRRFIGSNGDLAEAMLEAFRRAAASPAGKGERDG